MNSPKRKGVGHSGLDCIEISVFLDVSVNLSVAVFESGFSTYGLQFSGLIFLFICVRPQGRETTTIDWVCKC
jgi:hypothetical protein